MRIIVSQIPPEGRDIDETLSIATEEGVSLETRVRVHLDRAEEDVFVRGNLSARMRLNCSRCLEEFEDSLDVPFEMAFFPETDQPEAGNGEIASSEILTEYYSDDEIDLGETIREQVILNLPIKPLCSEECRGICPSCGKNLNLESCGCKAESVDPRLEVLKKYLNKGKE